MTSRPNLTGLLLAVPGAAAAFAAITGWAAHTDPAPASTARPAGVVVANPDPAIQQAISAQNRELATLRRQLLLLNGQLNALHQPVSVPAPGVAGAGRTQPGLPVASTGSFAGGSISVGGSAGGSAPIQPAPTWQRSAPVSQPAPSAPPPSAPPPSSAPPPPPPTQVTTGASGTHK